MAIEALSDIRRSGTSAFATGGGGGSLSLSQVTLDFGSSPVYSRTLTFSDASAVAGCKIMISEAPESDESEFDGILANACCLVDGTVTVYAAAIPGPVMGTRKFNYFMG